MSITTDTHTLTLAPAPGDWAITPDMEFLELLLHDDRNSSYCVPCKNDGGFHQGSCILKEQVLSKYSTGRYGRRDDQYISVSGFTGKERSNLTARQVNAIFIDLDCHDMEGEALRSCVEEAWKKIYVALMLGGPLVEHSELWPSWCVDSGRGIQLWYILDRSIPVDGSDESERALAMRRKLFYRLGKLFGEIAGVESDKSVVDLARVGRIPGTFNSKAGVYARTLWSSDSCISMSGCMAALDSFEADEEAIAEERHHPIKDFSPLLHDRQAALVALRDRRKADGDEHLRKETIFAYAEAVVRQYSAEDARELVEEYNEGFAHPLPQTEVRSAFGSAMRRLAKGFKTYGAQRLKDHLGIDDAEAVRFFGASTSRDVKRAEARKRKAERNERISQMLSQGFSYSGIAQAVGCTKQTIYNYVRALKERDRAQKEAWKAALAAKRAKSSKKPPSIGSETSRKGKNTCMDKQTGRVAAAWESGAGRSPGWQFAECALSGGIP